MRRYRLSSLLLLVAIAALACALFVQQRQANLREQKLMAEIKVLRADQLRTTLVSAIDDLIATEAVKAAAVRETGARKSADKASESDAARDER